MIFILIILLIILIIFISNFITNSSQIHGGKKKRKKKKKKTRKKKKKKKKGKKGSSASAPASSSASEGLSFQFIPKGRTPFSGRNPPMRRNPPILGNKEKNKIFSPIGCNPLLYKPCTGCGICGGMHNYTNCPLIIENNKGKKCTNCGSYSCFTSTNCNINKLQIKKVNVTLTPITYYNDKLFIMIHQRSEAVRSPLKLGSIGGGISPNTPVNAIIGEAREEAQLRLDNECFTILNTSGISRDLLSYFTILHIQNTAIPDSLHEWEINKYGKDTVIAAIKNKYGKSSFTDHYVYTPESWYIWISIEAYLEIAKPDSLVYKDGNPNWELITKMKPSNPLYYSSFYRIIYNFNQQNKDAFIKHLKKLEWLKLK